MTYLPLIAHSFKRAGILLTIVVCIAGGLQAQNKTVDSLMNMIHSGNIADTSRIHALLSLAHTIRGNEPNRSVQFMKEATALSHKIKFLHGEALSLINTGDLYYDMGKNKEALEFWFQSIAVYKKMAAENDPYIHSLGLHGITDNLIAISRLYCEMGELRNFEKHVAEARELMKNNPKEYSRLGWIGIEWAGCYFSNGKYAEARSLYYDALRSFSKVNDEYGIANTLANLGMLQDKLDHTDSAQSYLDRSLVLYKKINSLDGQSWVNNILGNIYKRQENFGAALFHFRQAYANGKQANNVENQISSLINLGNLYSDHNQGQDAFLYWTRAHDLAVKFAVPEYIITTSKALARYSEKRGDYKEALNYFKNYQSVKDSLNTDENMKAIGKLESQYDFDKEQAKLASQFEEELNTQRSQAVADRRQQTVIISTVTIGLIVVGLFSLFLYNRVRVTRRQKHLIGLQSALVMEKNKEIMDSINYAKRIQAAVLPATATFKKFLPDSFIIYKPKDIVAGDFYWLEFRNDTVLVAACDCTGHGVPGAMVSVICNNGLNRSVREHNITSPDEILNKTRQIVIEEFEKSDENVNDGMDVALVGLKYKNGEEAVRLDFSGANNPVWISRKGMTEIEVIAGDKQPIGKFENPKPYHKHETILHKGDMIYLFTDGYKDQFGGDTDGVKNGRGKKFKAARLRRLLLSIRDKHVGEQKEMLEEAFESWRGKFEQIDDVCVIGIRI